MTAQPYSSFGIPVRIYWEDTDAGGIVFYANYLKFFERARTEWLRSMGLNQHTLQEQTGGMFVVSNAEIKYHKSAKLDDLLTVTARIHTLGKASVVFTQEAYDASTNALLVQCNVRLGWVHAQSMQPGRIPQAVLAAMTAASAAHT